VTKVGSTFLTTLKNITNCMKFDVRLSKVIFHNKMVVLNSIIENSWEVCVALCLKIRLHQTFGAKESKLNVTS